MAGKERLIEDIKRAYKGLLKTVNATEEELLESRGYFSFAVTLHRGCGKRENHCVQHR